MRLPARLLWRLPDLGVAAPERGVFFFLNQCKSDFVCLFFFQDKQSVFGIFQYTNVYKTLEYMCVLFRCLGVFLTHYIHQTFESNDHCHFISVRKCLWEHLHTRECVLCCCLSILFHQKHIFNKN